MVYERSKRALSGSPAAHGLQQQQQPLPSTPSSLGETGPSPGGRRATSPSPSPVAMSHAMIAAAAAERGRRESRGGSSVNTVSLDPTQELEDESASASASASGTSSIGGSSIAVSRSRSRTIDPANMVFNDPTQRAKSPAVGIEKPHAEGPGDSNGGGLTLGTLQELAPVIAAHAAKSATRVLALAFLLPLLLRDGAMRLGLLHGALAVRDPLSVAYLCCVGAIIVLSTPLGALLDRLPQRAQRRLLLLALLAGLCLGPIALLVLLHQPHAPWAAVAAVLAATVILGELIGLPLWAELTALQPGATASRVALLANQAALGGTALAAALVGVPVLIASRALDSGDLATARHGCIAGVAFNVLAMGYVTARLGPGINFKQQQRQQQIAAAARSSNADHDDDDDDDDDDGLGASDGSSISSGGSGGSGQQSRGHRVTLSSSVNVINRADGCRDVTGGEAKKSSWAHRPAGQWRQASMTVCRALATSPPGLVRFLLLRSIHQAGCRALPYLAVTYILRHLHLKPAVAANALVLAACAAAVGSFLSLGLVAAHDAAARRRQACAARARQAFSASVSAVSAAGVTAATTIAAARGGQQHHADGWPSSSSDSEHDHQPLAKSPLLVALAALTVAVAATPTEVLVTSSPPSLELSRELGTVYILACVLGTALGFGLSYGQGLLTFLAWPHGVTLANGAPSVVMVGVKPGLLTSVFLSGSALWEWAAVLLYAGFAGWGVRCPLWALIPFLGLTFVATSLVLIAERLRACVPGGHEDEVAARAAAMTRHRQDGEAGAPEEGPRMSKRMSFFLLRSLPSHLSTIAESPLGATQQGFMSPTTTISSVGGGEEEQGPPAPRIDRSLH